MGTRAILRFHDVVVIQVRGDRNENARVAWGLISELIGWLLQEGIHPVFPSTTGATEFVGYFRPEDAPRVREWLEAHNERTDDEVQG